MERHELICFSLDPRLSASDARALIREALGREIQPHPGARLAVLPLEAARKAQRTLTRGGVVCNHRPLPQKRDLRLSETAETRPCPRCGTAAEIPAGRRNYRCPICRHPILRHGREIPAPATPKTPPPPETRPASRSVTTLLTVALMLIAAGTAQPHPFAGAGRHIWNRAVAPLAREFHVLTQAMALARRHSRGAAAASPPPPTAVKVTPEAIPETAGTDMPAPAPVSPVAAVPPVSESSPRPKTSPPLPRLPEAVRRSRSLGELQTALTAEIENAPPPSPAAFPETPPLPAQAVPPVPPPLDIPAERIAAAVATLDAHLARKAPFLRRLYTRDLEQLAQLRRLPGMAAADGSPGHPPSERPAAHTDTAPATLPPMLETPFGLCPIRRRPAPLCPA